MRASVLLAPLVALGCLCAPRAEGNPVVPSWWTPPESPPSPPRFVPAAVPPEHQGLPRASGRPVATAAQTLRRAASAPAPGAGAPLSGGAGLALRTAVAGVALSLALAWVGLRLARSRRRLFAGLWLTACTYPVVALVLPPLLEMSLGRGVYLAVAETFAPAAECALFWAAFGVRGESWRGSMWRDFAAIVLANLASFGAGEVLAAGGWFGQFSA